MKNAQLFLFVFIMLFNVMNSQTIYNLKLKNELDSIYKSDQIIREFIDDRTTSTRKLEIEEKLGFKINNLNDAFGLMIKNDSLNLKRIEYLIQNYGYAGKSLVGEPTNKTMWYIIQHSNKIKKHYPIIAKAGMNNEIPKTLVALMYDRILVNDGKKQIYGTQAKFVTIKNKETGKVEVFKYIPPIKDESTVNIRRKKIGFNTTVEENATELGVVYKKFTFKDLQIIFKENDIIN